MTCQRCGGFMVVELDNNLLGTGTGSQMDAARCVNCGYFEDSTIRANKTSVRLRSHASLHSGGDSHM